MPVPVINYSAQQPQGYPLANSFLQAIAEGLKVGNMNREMGQDFRQRELANQLSQVNLDYAPKVFEGNILQQELANKLSGIELNYAPQKNELDILKAKQDMSYVPLKYEMDMQKLQQQKERFGQVYQARQYYNSLPPDLKNVFAQQNPDLMMDIVGGQLNNAAEANNPTGNSYTLSPEQIESLRAAGIATEGNGIPQAQSSGYTQSPLLPPPRGMSGARYSNNRGNTDEFQRAAEISLGNSLSTKDVQVQKEAVDQLDSFFNNEEFNRKVKSASKYAGLIGRVKLYQDRALQQIPGNSNLNQSLLDYDSLKNFDMVWALNRIKSADKMGSTDSQRHELENIWNKGLDSLYSNPEHFVAQMENLKGSLKRLGDAVNKSYDKLGLEKKREGRNMQQGSPKKVYVNPDTWEIK